MCTGAPAMTITLTPQLEAMIQKKVASGQYDTASDVVEEALQLLDEKERIARLKAAIAVGMADVERGAVVEWDRTPWPDSSGKRTKPTGWGCPSIPMSARNLNLTTDAQQDIRRKSSRQ